ncbi:MAG TPA: hypothetical protein VNX68_01200 [Nitrosopumilaceae archaeon]|jgi:hypothetical protein|nr:hypothetical protein [Nitrosopumilaceae archaeon]
MNIKEFQIKKVDNEYYLLSEDDIKTRDWVLRPDSVVLKMTDSDMVDYLQSESLATKKIIASSKQLNNLPCVEVITMDAKTLIHGINTAIDKTEWTVEVEMTTFLRDDHVFVSDGKTYPLETIERPRSINGYVHILKIK